LAALVFELVSKGTDRQTDRQTDTTIKKEETKRKYPASQQTNERERGRMRAIDNRTWKSIMKKQKKKKKKRDAYTTERATCGYIPSRHGEEP
jgi:hypothetical protein